MKSSAILLCRTLFVFLAFFIWLFSFTAKEAQAATLGRTYDRLSTSRPSASAPLASDQAANADQLLITDLNDNVIFLASDSAVLMSDTGQTLNTVTVASASAADTPAASQRTLFFAENIANSHHAGTAVYTAVSAMHEIYFLATNTIPNGGDILLTFPALTSGDANNPASPSATTFQFNGISSTQIKISDDGTALTPSTITVTNPGSGTSGTIRIVLDDGEITAGSIVRIFLGCTDSTPTTSCDEYSPRIINPTQSTTASGTARIWTLKIETMDGSDVGIDSATIRIGTVDAVWVQGTVDSSLSVTIAGVSNGGNINGTSGCASETTNSGLTPTATNVNLGNLGTTINIAAQTITVSTNSNFGYTITATSSGRFVDPATGFYIPDVNTGNGLTANDTPIPAGMTAGTPAFGLFPCGQRVPTSSPDWNDELTIGSGGSGAKGSNPWNSNLTTGYYATIATHTGPVSSEATALRYATTISATTPAGVYRNYFTYVVTPTF